jgi:hypothetical protein
LKDRGVDSTVIEAMHSMNRAPETAPANTVIAAHGMPQGD